MARGQGHRAPRGQRSPLVASFTIRAHRARALKDTSTRAASSRAIFTRLVDGSSAIPPPPFARAATALTR